MSTGDVITPSAVQYYFSGIFDDSVRIKIRGYNIETVMGEKVETVLSHGIFNTRLKDYYNIYILNTTQKYDKKLFQEALAATEVHRGSTDNIADSKAIITLISGCEELQDMWVKYQIKFVYVQDVPYEQIMEVLMWLMQDS